MGFPDSFVEEVRRTADIVRLISDHVGLRKMGVSWKGLCPFHQEKTPSFNVRNEPPLFHCFGCGEGGDVFKFVMLHDKVSFPEAIEIVARRFGLQVPETRTSADFGPDRKQREEMLALLEAAAQHFTNNLWTAPGTRAREYLLGRGFQKDTLERIRAGAAPDSWNDLFGALRPKFSPEAMLAAGMVLPGQDGKRPYDRFRNRAIFTILNDQGKVVAFGARSLDGSEPKYLNSPESPVYQKSRTLYGLSWAKDAIRKESRAVLMEGYLDVARAIESGVGEAVATCGTALTAGHLRLLRRFTERAVMNFDQDAAGQKAARKSLDLFLEEHVAVQVVELPEGHDPDSYLKAEGADAYRERLAAAPAGMDWLIRRTAGDHDLAAPAGKAAYLNALLPALSKIENAVERAAWMPLIARTGGLDPRAAQEDLRKALATRTPIAPAEELPPSPPVAAARLLPAEAWLLVLLLKGATGVPEALRELDPADFEGLRSQGVLQRARRLVEEGRALTTAAVMGEDEAEQRLLTQIALADAKAAGAGGEEHRNPLECVREIQRQAIKARVGLIQQREARASEDERLALFAEKVELKRRMASL